MRTHYKCCGCSAYFPIEPNTMFVAIPITKRNPNNRLICAYCKACETVSQISQRILSQSLFDRPQRESQEHAITSELAFIVHNQDLLAALNNGHGFPFETHFAYGNGATIGIPGMGIIPRLKDESQGGGEQ